MKLIRKIEKPKEVDPTKLKSTLTTDGILVVEASMPPYVGRQLQRWICLTAAQIKKWIGRDSLMHATR